MPKEKVSVIVLAAGSGSRMQSAQKKQFIPILGHPMIYYSLSVFQECPEIDEIILVTATEDMEYCKEQIVDKYNFYKVRKVVPGSEERYLSVYEGLKSIDDTTYVLIHDGARPLLDLESISRILTTLREGDSCVLGMPVKDTIKKVNENHYAVETPNRNELWMSQTPQAFPYRLILDSYKEVIEKQVTNVTDDAMVLELATTKSIKLIEGSYKNIKVTTPEDLQIVELFLKEKNKK